MKISLISRTIAIVSICASILVILGWILNIEILKSIIPGLIAMKFNTALAFIFLSSSLLFLETKYDLVAYLGGLLAFTLGLLNLIEYFLGKSLGIDEFFIKDPSAVLNTLPGRMAIMTAIGFVLLGITVVLIKRGYKRIPGILSIFTLINGYISLTAFTVGVTQYYVLYNGTAFEAMALNTSILFMLLSIAFLLISSDNKHFHLMSADSTSAIIFRQAILFFIISIPVFHFIITSGQKAAYYTENIEEFLEQNIALFIFIFIARVITNQANKVEQERESVELKKKEEISRALKENQELYRKIFTSSADAIMTLEPPNWKFTEGNPATIKMFAAKNAEEFESAEPWKLSPEKQPDGRLSAEKAMEMIETAMREGNNFFHWTHKRLTGEEFPATVLLTKVTVGDKSFLQATVRDLTEQVKAEKSIEILHGELSESEEKYKLIFDSSPLCIKIFDKQGKFIFINKTGMREHFLKTDEEARNWNYLSAIDDAYVDRLKTAMQDALAGKESEVDIKHKLGTSIYPWCKGFFVPIKSDKGEITGVIFSSLDITETKQFEEKVAKLNDARREFASVTAHQIFNPVTLIDGNVEMLSEELNNNNNNNNIPAKDLELLNSIKRGTAQIKELVNFLLKIARTESTGIKFNRAPISLDLITLESIDLIREDLDKRGQKISITKEPDPMPVVFMDYEALKQVIVNLISNASRYSKNDQEILISMKLTGTNILYSVQDKGIGIPENAKGSIFNKFFRADNARSKISEGTGLGLALAKSLVEAWGGKISFESAEDKGTTFSVTIPVIGKSASITRETII